jgi:hypothetical protein
LITSSSLASAIFATFSPRTKNTTTRSERTYRCRRTRRFGVMCAEQGACARRRSWAGYTINMFEFEFPTGTGVRSTTSWCSVTCSICCGASPDRSGRRHRWRSSDRRSWAERRCKTCCPANSRAATCRRSSFPPSCWNCPASVRPCRMIRDRRNRDAPTRPTRHREMRRAPHQAGPLEGRPRVDWVARKMDLSGGRAFPWEHGALCLVCHTRAGGICCSKHRRRQ